MAVQLSPFEALKREDVMPAYIQILTNVNHCINLFEEMNQERNFVEWVMDWAVRERSEIDFDSVIFNFKAIKSELEKGIELYSYVHFQLNSFELHDNTYKLKIEDARHCVGINSELVRNHDEFLKQANTEYENFSTVVTNLLDTGIFGKKDFEWEDTPLVKGGIEIGVKEVGIGATGIGLAAISGTVALGAVTIATGEIAVVAGVIGCLAYCYAHSKGKERGVQYKHLKYLSDGLNTNELLAVFQTYHSTIRGISNGIDKILKMCKEHLEIRVTENRIIENKITYNSPDNNIRATRIYDNAMRDNLQMLLASEPNMNEAIRKRIATNTAVTACKTFLKETLGYSDSDADKFIQNLQ